MWSRLFAGGLWFLVLAAVPVSAGSGPARPALPALPSDRPGRNLALFDEVLDLVVHDYYDPKLHGVDWTAAAAQCRPKAAAAADDASLYAAINAMLGLLKDSHTHLWTAAQAHQMLTQKSVRTGIGLQLIGKSWAVDEVLPGSPAEAAGVMPGWILVTRAGRPLGDSLENFDPAAGEVVPFGFLDRRDRPVLLSLPERLIPDRPAARTLAGGVAYLRFDLFNSANCFWWLHNQLFAAKRAPGMIVDLRHNSGGELFLAGEALSDFFPHRIDYGEALSRSGHEKTMRSFHFLTVRYLGPLAVLVDGATASAAEIFAAVLQQQHRAVVVGSPTAGAVLCSNFLSLADGGRLQLSVQDYVLPGGRRPEGHPVQPDVAVAPFTLADLRAGRDPGLAAALAALR